MSSRSLGEAGCLVVCLCCVYFPCSYRLFTAGLPVPADVVTHEKTQKGWPLTRKVIFFASDGMRPDLMEKYAAERIMPTYADLLKKGVKGENGLLQGFPPIKVAGAHNA